MALENTPLKDGLATNRLDTTLDTVELPVIAIEQSITSTSEIITQFSVGGFLCVGSFWLGIERYVTVIHGTD